MALSRGMIFLGRQVLLLLLVAQLLFFCCDIFFSISAVPWIFLRILLIMAIFMLNFFVCVLFGLSWMTKERYHYPYVWLGYTTVLIGNIMVVCTLHMAVVDAEQDNLFGPTDFVKVLCITPFILLLFLNTAGEEGTEFHGESKWLFVTMSAQIFDAIDMIDNVSNGNRDGTPIGLGVGMITLAFGCLLLAAWEFHELEHHAELRFIEAELRFIEAKVYRLLGLILVNLATLIIRAVVYVDYGWRETTSVAKNIIVICTSVSELRRYIGQTSRQILPDDVVMTRLG